MVVVAVARNSALEVARDTDIMMAAEAAAKLVPDLWSEMTTRLDFAWANVVALERGEGERERENK